MHKRQEYKSEEAYRKAKRNASQRYRNRTGSGNGYSHWTIDQYWTVMKHEKSDREIAHEIGHSVSAIQAARRRIRLGQVDLPGYDAQKHDALIALTSIPQE